MNALVGQIRDLFESMTPGARITAGLLLVVAVVSVAYLFQGSAAGPDAFIFGGERFSQSEINRMTAAMAEAGLTGWTEDSNRISVPRSRQEEYIAAIASGNALPDNFASLMDKALSEASPMEGRRQWELRTKTARENQLSLILSKMPWVESAHVMLDIEERRGFNRRNDASASVFVTPRPGEGVDKSRARGIKMFVAGALASLSEENVQITSGGETFEADEPWFDDEYLQARAELQKAYKRDIQNGLNFIPGVRVEVSADLENLASRSVTESTPSEGKVVSSQTEREKEETNVNDGGGQPGYVASSSARRGLDEDLAHTNTSSVERETSNEQSAVGFTTSEEEYMGFKPKELYASIAIPRDYVLDIWKQKNPEGDPTELTDTEMQSMENSVKIDVERFVQNILPRLSLGEDDYQQVEVIFIDSIKRDAPPEPSLADTALAWASRYWTTLSMLGLAGVSLLMLRSTLRSSGEVPSSSSAPLQLDFANQQSNEAADGSESEHERPKLKLKKGDSLKEDLSDMVREDPDAAANILRSWISNSA